jgi:hypothetical protein
MHYGKQHEKMILLHITKLERNQADLLRNATGFYEEGKQYGMLRRGKNVRTGT